MPDIDGVSPDAPAAGAHFDDDNDHNHDQADDAGETGHVDIAEWSTRFDLLSDPHRLEILLLLHRHPGIIVGDIATDRSASPNGTSPTVSATPSGRTRPMEMLVENTVPVSSAAGRWLIVPFLASNVIPSARLSSPVSISLYIAR